MSYSDDEFEEQLRQENAEKQRLEDIASGKIKVDPDGTVYDWDDEKKAWFPRVDEDFLARYQMAYGTENQPTSEQEAIKDQTKFDPSNMPDPSDPSYAEWYKNYTEYYSNIDTNSEEYRNWYNYYYGDSSTIANVQDSLDIQEGQKDEPTKDQKGKKKDKNKIKRPAPPPEPPKWFDMDDSKNTNVYVDGLPDTMTEEKLIALMSKCGLIMHDPRTKKPKVKLYKDPSGNVKGDARCCYIKCESVDLALQILDGSEVDGHKITVQKAKFEMKGDYDPSKKKKKLTNNEKRKAKERQEKLFDWHLEKPLERKKWEKVIILKNVFNLKDFDKNPMAINDVRQDLRSECEKYGDLTKVTIYDRHPEGVASIHYKTHEAADICIEALHGRFFAGRQVKAEAWDGRTKYEVEETTEEKEMRLKGWEQYLEGSGDDKKQDGDEKKKHEGGAGAASEEKPKNGEESASS